MRAFVLLAGRAYPESRTEVVEVHAFSQWEEGKASVGTPPRDVAKVLVNVDRSSGDPVDQFGDLFFEKAVDQPGIGPIATWLIEPLAPSNVQSWTSTRIFPVRALPEWHAPNEPLFLLLGEESIERIVMRPEPQQQWKLHVRVSSASKIEAVREEEIEIKRVFRVEFVTRDGRAIVLASGDAQAVFDRKRKVLAQNDIRYELRLKGPDGPCTPVRVTVKREKSQPE